MAKYIEEGTNYSYIVKRMKDVNFRSLRSVSVDFTKRLPEDLSSELYKDIQHGVCQLQSEPELNMYIHALGMMHEAKLQHAFEHLAIDFFSHSSIDIIDYGCGQAIGTICYADFLREKGYSQKVRKVTLIEPSELALKRAALHVSCFFPNAEIITILKGFDDLVVDDINVDEDIPTLHIFSNVIDLADDCFDLEQFVKLINNSSIGENQYLCVEPYFNYDEEDDKLQRFIELLDAEIYYTKVFCKGEFVEGREWTCNVAIGENDKNLVIYKDNVNLLMKYAEEAENTKNYKKAFKYYRLAARKGYVVAQYKLGKFYYEGNVDKVYSEIIEKSNHYEIGFSYYKGEIELIFYYGEAIKWFRKAAKQGYVEALYLLGECYFEGHGVQKNLKEAVKWYRKAMNQGYAKAKCMLGICYNYGYGVIQNDIEAVKLYREAAEQGVILAQWHLGCCYEIGEGVEKNEVEAAKWFIEAAKHGDAAAQYKVGIYYEYGFGVVKDKKKAFELYRKSAEQGDWIAQYNLGIRYYFGRGIDKDYLEAVKWYRKAVEKDIYLAQFHLGVCYNFGRGVIKDKNEAMKWYFEALKSGYTISSNEYGYEYGHNRYKGDVKIIKEYVKKANQGDCSAQFELGVCYENGIGVVMDDECAVEWYRKAAEQGFSKAQNNLGICYENGIGVIEDKNEAVKWYYKSAQQGYMIAQYNLAVCYYWGRGVIEDNEVAMRWLYKSTQGILFEDF